MAVSLNSVAFFNQAATNTRREFPPKITVRKTGYTTQYTAQVKLSRFDLSATKGENVTATNEETTSTNISDPKSSSIDDQIQTSESETQKTESSSPEKPISGLKKTPLTARERLRAARVLSRYTEPKSETKPELNSKLLDALKESDKGKRRPGLPEAPTNLFDDSKRGMPKQGWTISLPGGMDVFFIVFSFVFISTVMFATTYLVWKVGAIHFNEY